MSETKKQPTAEQRAQIAGLAKGYTIISGRAPILRTPESEGLKFEELTFPSMDGVPLEAWYIPANEESNKLIIFNHPMTFSRSGFPGHLEPWSAFAPIDVNFIKIYKNLHDAGYNVLTYDFRNHGRSGDMSPHNYAMNVKVPTFIIQVHDDAWTVPEDVQTTFDLIGTEEKKLFWVEGTTARFDGYNYFGVHPEQMIEWFDTYMK